MLVIRKRGKNCMRYPGADLQKMSQEAGCLFFFFFEPGKILNGMHQLRDGMTSDCRDL